MDTMEKSGYIKNPNLHKGDIMKSIDIKSMIIGVLLTLTIVFAMGAVPKDTGEFAAKTGLHSAAWDNEQQWEIISRFAMNKEALEDTVGYEPFAVDDRGILYRKRIK